MGADVQFVERDGLCRRHGFMSDIGGSAGAARTFSEVRAWPFADLFLQPKVRSAARSGRSIADRTKQRLGEEDLREAGDAGGPPRTRRQVEMRQACLPVGQVAPVAPATYQGFVKR